jgi:hypothetical protein
MTAQQPLLFDGLQAAPPASKKTRTKDERPMCSCGHEMLHHDGKGCTFGRGTRFGGCPCKKLRDRKKRNEKPLLPEPAGAITLTRPDTVKTKVMGWALVEGTKAVLYVGLHTKPPNVMFRTNHRNHTIGAMIQARLRGTCAKEAVVKANLGGLGKPSKVTLTRLCPGKPDDDGLIGALKFVRDGVAAGLGFDDAQFSVNGADPAKVPLFYAQRGPGKGLGKVRGFLIELQFTGS